MTLKHERQYRAAGESAAKLVIRTDGTVIMTSEMAPYADEALGIIFEVEQNKMDNDEGINSRLRREDLEGRIVKDEITAEPKREIDLDSRTIWH